MKQQETQPTGIQSISSTEILAEQKRKLDAISGGGQVQPGKWAVFAIVAIGVFMATLDSSIVNISLPIIARDFGVPLSGAVEWVIIAYLVVTAGVLLTAGRLADMVGRKVVWAVGLGVFTASTLRPK